MKGDTSIAHHTAAPTLSFSTKNRGGEKPEQGYFCRGGGGGTSRRRKEDSGSRVHLLCIL